MTYYDPFLGYWGLVPGGRALARASQKAWAVFNDGLETAYRNSNAAVADVAKTTDGHIDRIRVLTGSVLGFGERVVEIPQPAFRIRDSNVLLSDFTADMVAQLPSAGSENNGPASQER